MKAYTGRHSHSTHSRVLHALAVFLLFPRVFLFILSFMFAHTSSFRCFPFFVHNNFLCSALSRSLVLSVCACNRMQWRANVAVSFRILCVSSSFALRHKQSTANVFKIVDYVEVHEYMYNPHSPMHTESVDASAIRRLLIELVCGTARLRLRSLNSFNGME